MRVLFVDSGGPGFHTRYAYDIYITLLNDFQYITRQISPSQLNPGLLRQFKPNVLLVVHGTAVPLRTVRYARTLGITTVLWLVEDPYEIDLHRGKMVEMYDLVFTNERQAVKEYRHPHVFYLPWCCNPYVHFKNSVSETYQSDICFVGMGFKNRVHIINAIAPLLKKLSVKLIGDWQFWSSEELHPDLKQFVIPTVHDFGEVQKYYNGAKINLNIHRHPTDPPSGNRSNVSATSPNDGAFALAGCGAFQIVDQTRSDLWNCFFENQEIIGFSNPDDLADKIGYYLKYPDQRITIGDNAQKKAYAQHTFKHRLNEIFEKLASIMGNRKRSFDKTLNLATSVTGSQSLEHSVIRTQHWSKN